jgi:hypothetical protein
MPVKTRAQGKTNKRRGAAVLAIGVVVGLSMNVGTAQAGFFDELFGGGQATQAPTYEQAPMPQVDLPDAMAPAHRRTKTVAVDAKPVLQKTTDLMHDKTLHPGDAIMMKDGIHIYSGAESSQHTKKQFVALDDARYVSSKQRSSLIAMDTTRNDPLTHDMMPDTIASGRSASVSTPIAAGYRITDARGASVRYVGP